MGWACLQTPLDTFVLHTEVSTLDLDLNTHTVKPLIMDPPKTEQPLYSGQLTCPD